MGRRGRPRKIKTTKTDVQTKTIINTACQNDDIKPETSKDLNNCQSEVEEVTFPSPKGVKKNSFDELLGNQYENGYLDHDAVKLTYKNRKNNSNSNKTVEYYDETVQFHDDANRNMILKWLNDNRNIFDRLTQTQEHSSQRRIDDVWMEDMLSVSQNPQKISPPKTQQNTKKSNKAKPKGQSKLDTSTPRAKSLDILITKEIKDRRRVKRHSITLDSRKCDNNPQLNNNNNNESNDVKIVKRMEEEYLDSLDEVLRDCKNGWDRMENIKKTIRKTMREHKQLDITLHNTQQQPNSTINKQIEDPLINSTEQEIINLISTVANLDEFEDFACKNIEKPLENCDNLNNCCQYHKGAVIEPVEKSINLKIIEKSEHYVNLLENLEINELSLLHSHYQKIKTIFDKITEKSDKQTQDCLKPLVEHVGIQTVIVDNSQQQQKLEQSPVKQEEKSKVEEFQDSQLFFNFETDDFLKESQTVIENRNFETHEIIDEPKVIEEQKGNSGDASDNSSVLIITKSGTIQETTQNRGVKRLNDDDNSDGESSSKKQRPCEKFIPDDLSIAFDSEDVGKIEESNHDNADKKTRTQELIQECDILIQNVTNQKLRKVDGNKRDTEEIFEENTMFINEDNISKINQEIDLFEAICSQDNDNDTNKENIIEKTPVKAAHTTSSSRKNLFGKDTDDSNETITPEKLDKINIIENIVIKTPNNVTDDIVIVSSQNDEDIVETTPQKNPAIYEKRNSFLDVTLPPPLEFQDNDERILSNSPIPSSLNRINSNNNRKYKHSTPNSNKFSSDFISLSPITLEKNPLELAQHSSLTIHMKPSTPTTNKRSQPLAKQRSILNYLQSPASKSQSQPKQQSQDSQQLTASSSEKPRIACTRITNDQLFAITALTNKKLAIYNSTFTTNVTHMIVSVDDQNRIKDHTIKYVLAVAAGIWVLNFKWIQECLTKNCIVPEEQYEVLDMSGVDGPRQSRLKHTTEPLLKNYKIYAAQPFVSTTLQDVETIVRLLGGKVVAHPESLLNKDGSICVIITEAKDTQDTNLYESWLELFKVITVDIEWLSRSVGQYRLLSLRPFTLCSDDSISNLGYPKELLAEVPFSFA